MWCGLQNNYWPQTVVHCLNGTIKVEDIEKNLLLNNAHLYLVI